MKLYNLGKVPWEESQLIYHALAEMGREALCLVSPASAYVCIGFHQDAPQEVDLAFCEANNIPVFRRDLGGGAVYLDGAQLFFHLILRKDNPEVPKRKEIFYQKFIQPVVDVYRNIGIAAEYKPVNDVIVGTRKISGTGVGEIGQCIVFVGNLIVDFNYRMMARVLKVPDEKFRDKIHQTLTENLSTIRRELGDKEARRWDEATLNQMMAEEFEKLLGPMERTEKDAELNAKMQELRQKMLTEDWLFQKGKPQLSGREVKIRSGAKVVHRMHKAKGGLIRADIEVIGEKIGAVSLSGDFFCFPEEGIQWLEAQLKGKVVTEIEDQIRAFYVEKQIETPGIGLEDWMVVFSDLQTK
ncbi:MAG: lipoate--protein ligase family protein [Deltaproteobacteria bacterium]|nr:lipoate--protein ligase family protein [Deltaproteobacteria bacterium]MBW1960640.1 lipoate--protein ligase family protein [Deltaproteobacteria bacterium]MBW2150646.1 lipoate--protein ligase family protein [Deltaproteobacteria bacterium]